MALYRRGVRAACPIDTVYLAGFDFPRVTEAVSGSGSQTRRSEIQGTVGDLSDGDLKRIAEAAARKAVRPKGEGQSLAKVFDLGAINYQPREGDMPMASLVYLEPVESSPHEERDPAGIDLGALIAGAGAGSKKAGK